MNRLIENISPINPLFIDQVELLKQRRYKTYTRFHTLSTNIQYFELGPRLWNNSEGISLKNYDVSCKVFHSWQVLLYPVPDTSMPLSAVSTIALPAVHKMAKEDEVVMKDWMENFRPVRQRTVRNETTNRTWKASGTQGNSQPKQKGHSYVELNTEPATPDGRLINAFFKITIITIFNNCWFSVSHHSK